MRILIADDEIDFIESMQRLLTKRGYSVDTASDGQKALEYISGTAYDLIFVDHNMPELTGLEVIQQVKEGNPDSKIVMISGYPAMKDFFAKHFGADDYLQKPVTLEMVLAVITRYEKKK